MNDVTERTNKDEMVSAAVEAIDHYQTRCDILQQQQQVLVGVCTLLTFILFL